MGLMLRVVLLVILSTDAGVSITITRSYQDSFTVQDASYCYLYQSSYLTSTSCKCDWLKKSDFIFNKDKKIGCVDGEDFGCGQAQILFPPMISDRIVHEADICPVFDRIEAYFWNLNENKTSENWVNITNHIDQYIVLSNTGSAVTKNLNKLKGNIVKLKCMSRTKPSCRLMKFAGTTKYPVNFTYLFNVTLTPATTPPSNGHSKQDDGKDIVVTLSVVIIVLLVLITIGVVYFFKKRLRSKAVKDKEKKVVSAKQVVSSTQIVDNENTYVELAVPPAYNQVSSDQVYTTLRDTTDDYTPIDLPSTYRSGQTNCSPQDDYTTLTPSKNENPDYHVLEINNLAYDYNES